jgi:multiple RNA-binding domain-containing protein 1
MESSRVFVKNLPPTISEAEFRKHFSAQGREVTDVKLIPHRRIGFVGYRSHDDAAGAVKYLNKSFIRMSRIAVDLAKPVSRPPSSPNRLGLLLIIDARFQTRPRDQLRRTPPRTALPSRLLPGLVLPV